MLPLLLALSIFFLYGIEEVPHPIGAIVFHSGGIAGALASIAYYAGMSNAFSTWAFHIPVIIDSTVFLQIIGFVLFAALLTTPVGIYRIGKMNLLEVVARHER